MTAVIERGTALTAPSVVPLPGTLLSLVTPSSGIAWLEPDDLYETFNCIGTSSTTEFPCAPGYAPAAKTFDSAPSWVSGIRFAVYLGSSCKAPGRASDTAARLRTAFDANETKGVERAVITDLFAGATDLTPAAGPVDLAHGIALLEGNAAVNYNGVPTIHVPRSIGSLMFSNLYAGSTGEHFFTKQGSKLVSGPGYEQYNVGPDGTAAAAGSTWLYASGELSLSAGEVIEQEQTDFSSNDVFVLVERMYVAAVDCYVSAVRVTI